MEFTAEVSIGLHRKPSDAIKIALSKLTKSLEIPKNLMNVILKPSIYDPNLIGNTHVEVVKAIIPLFRSLGPIQIVESDNPLRGTMEAFEKTGYTRFSGSDVTLINLTELPRTEIKMPGHFFHHHSMPLILTKPYFFINVPTVKLEPSICNVGAGIKNLFGLLPEVDKSIYHTSIDDILLDLLIAFRPNLTIVDLTTLVIGSREKGISRDIGAVIVGTDSVAVDSFCANLLDVDPLDITYLRRAYELGLGEVLLDRIRVNGTESQKEKLTRLCKI